MGKKILGLILLAMLTAGCGNRRADDGSAERAPEAELQRDPLPGDLVEQTIREDSIRNERNKEYKAAMTKVLADYRKKFRNSYFTGYFLTDLDNDGYTELWVKSGSVRDNSRLELYYPMPDGTLRQSETLAEPGEYFLGDSYLIQVVGAGPGLININRVGIYNGTMDIENLRTIDLYANPKAQIPTFEEKPIRAYSLSNLSPLK